MVEIFFGNRLVKNRFLRLPLFTPRGYGPATGLISMLSLDFRFAAII
jgi:hypothetical protein